MSSHSAMLSVRDLSVSYAAGKRDSVMALQGVNADVGDGEIMALLGPSGCGKTTLLRTIAGLILPDSGTVTLAGTNLARIPTHQRDIGLMFQDHALFPHLDVQHNVAFGLEMSAMPSGLLARRVDEVLHLVGLQHLANRSVQELSGGEAQRVALARALAPQPKLLMLDEPLGSLDRTLREELAQELRAVITEQGLTAVHVTHDQVEAFSVADRVAVMDAGRIVAIGPPEDLWRNPGTEFVARFLGHPNVVSHPEINGGALTLVPVGALEAVDPSQSGPTDVILAVERSEFSEGTWKVISTPPVRFVFRTTDRPEPGSTVHLKVDRAQLRPVSATPR